MHTGAFSCTWRMVHPGIILRPLTWSDFKLFLTWILNYNAGQEVHFLSFTAILQL